MAKGILTSNGHLNVWLVVGVQDGTVFTVPVTTECTETEARQQAQELFPNGKITRIEEYEVLSKDVESGKGTHEQFVADVHSVMALYNRAIKARFGEEPGWHWSVRNAKLDPAINDLITNSRDFRPQYTKGTPA